MALLNNYGSGNRVIINDKAVTYSKRKIYGSWSFVDGTTVTTYTEAWEYHRYCAKTYMYVGMSQSAANNCVAAMVNKYTRNFNISEWDENLHEFSDEYGGSQCMADICSQQREGHMYDVQICVREDDFRIRIGSFSPEALFSGENNRDYDTGA